MLVSPGKHQPRRFSSNAEQPAQKRQLARRIVEPGLEVEFLFRVVRDDVLAATDRAQEPAKYGSLGGQAKYFVPASANSAQGSAQPASVAQALTPEESLKREKEASDAEEQQFWLQVRQAEPDALHDPLEDYIRKYPSGRYTAVAQRLLTGGTESRAAPPVSTAALTRRCRSIVEFVVYFGWDRSNLDQPALETIDAAVAQMRAVNLTNVIIVGHNDTSSSERYALGLSQRRAAVVRDALVARGVGSDIIEMYGAGEKELAQRTADGVREPLNRRTSVIFCSA
jgi:outer membrane protein OmpA-like peptidoglycan-associated protein